jgi:hypothetical protein
MSFAVLVALLTGLATVEAPPSGPAPAPAVTPSSASSAQEAGEVTLVNPGARVWSVIALLGGAVSGGLAAWAAIDPEGCARHVFPDLNIRVEVFAFPLVSCTLSAVGGHVLARAYGESSRGSSAYPVGWLGVATTAVGLALMFATADQADAPESGKKRLARAPLAIGPGLALGGFLIAGLTGSQRSGAVNAAPWVASAAGGQSVGLAASLRF